MSDSYISIVCGEEYIENAELKSEEILQWLIEENIVKSEKSDSILGGDFGHSVASGAAKIVKIPAHLPFDLLTNGVELITESQVFDPGENYEEDQELPESNLGFTFWNWPEFTDEFLAEFESRLGTKTKMVFGRI